MKRIDLTGQTFGKWTVIEFSRFRSNAAYWTCRCVCGKVYEVQSHALRNGLSSSCMSCSNRISLVGEVFGDLTVIERDNEKETYWICRCSCGNMTSVFTGNLMSEQTKTCGQHGRHEDLVGQIFGRWKVLSFSHVDKESRTAFWNCECECGNIKKLKSYSLTSGQSKSCGCYKKDKLSEDRRSSTRTRYGKYKWYFYDNEKKISCRSSYEVIFWNYFYFIKNMNIQYEPKTFIIDSHTRYTPDFYFPDDDLWIEIKGSFDDFNSGKDQLNKIKVLEKDGININIFYWKDILNTCDLPFSYSTFFNKAKKENMSVEDYLANMKYI